MSLESGLPYRPYPHSRHSSFNQTRYDDSNVSTEIVMICEESRANENLVRGVVMSQTSQAESSTTQTSTSNTQSSTQTSNSPGDDDWSAVTDPNERRKIQNRIAQRKFREKVRQQKEDTERNDENQRRAAGSYTTAEPEEVDADEEGLPWGSISLRHVITSGRTKEQNSRESSIYAAASKAGGSSRLGLHLIDNYARGSPAWAAWRARFAPLVGHIPPNRMLWSRTMG